MSGANVESMSGRGLAVVALALSCFLLGASAAKAELVFRHPDGSLIHFAGTPRAWCGPWSGEATPSSVHVELRSERAAWEMRGVQRDLQVGRRIEFPNSFASRRPSKAFLFVGRRNGSIEASSAEEESGGSMVFRQLSCELDGVVEFSVHATLGSELFDGERVRISGTYRGQVSEPPSVRYPASSPPTLSASS